MRTNSAQESSLEEGWLQQGLEGEVGLELWVVGGRQYVAGKEMTVGLGRVLVGRRTAWNTWEDLIVSAGSQ